MFEEETESELFYEERARNCGLCVSGRRGGEVWKADIPKTNGVHASTHSDTVPYPFESQVQR